MKNIVFMCDTYLPKASPNGICVEAVANNLFKKGYKVSVITTPNIDGQLKMENINGIDVYRINPGFVVNELNAVDGKNDNKSLKRKKRALMISKINGALNAFKYPLSAPVQIKNYLKCIQKLEKNRHIDVVVCCYHKIAAVAAGIKFKKKNPNTKFIVYTLDAISGGLIFPVLNSRNIALKSLKRWEKRIFSMVDKAFVMESHRKHYDNVEYDNIRSKLEYLDIPLLKIERLTKECHDSKTIHFVYTGSMSDSTANPKYFIEILKNIKEDVVFDIYGNIDKNVMNVINNNNGDNKISIKGKVPYNQIDNIQKEADILLNFGNANPCMIPCKIFEYISTGKKIISFTYSELDSSLPYLKKYPNVLIIDENNDIDENISKIEEFINSPLKDIDEEILSSLYKKNIPDYFYNQINKLLEDSQ